MRKKVFWASLIGAGVVYGAVAACGAGGDAGGPGGGGDVGGHAGMGGSAGSGLVDDCAGPADCPGGSCERVPNEPGGYWTCVFPPAAPVTEASDNPDEDHCTNAGDCSPGCDCYLVHEVCYAPPHNVCLCDECQTDADCNDPANELCVPAGAWAMPRNQCRPTECKTHADCTSAAGGLCIALVNGCCALYGVEPALFAGKFCHYDDDECMTDTDCPEADCVPDTLDSGLVCGMWFCPG